AKSAERGRAGAGTASECPPKSRAARACRGVWATECPRSGVREGAVSTRGRVGRYDRGMRTFFPPAREAREPRVPLALRLLRVPRERERLGRAVLATRAALVAVCCLTGLAAPAATGAPPANSALTVHKKDAADGAPLPGFVIRLWRETNDRRGLQPDG